VNREGSATVLVLCVLVFLSALFLAASASIGLSAHSLQRSQRLDGEVRALKRAAEAAVEALAADPTPFADAPTDPVWSRLRWTAGDEPAVTLEDVSSRLGLNWIRRELLQDMGVLKPGRTSGDLQRFREEQGVTLRLQTFSPLIREEELERMFTVYGYFNLNLADVQVLQRLHVQRGADLAEAESFRALLEQARAQERNIEPEALPEFMGEENYRLLFPVVNAEAALNVHFVPEAVLEGLFRHCGQPREDLDRLLQARRGAELTPGKLQSLLSGRTDVRSPLKAFLGLQTWFWRITVRGGGRRLVWVVARVPRAAGNPEYRRLVEPLEPGSATPAWRRPTPPTAWTASTTAGRSPRPTGWRRSWSGDPTWPCRRWSCPPGRRRRGGVS